MNPQTNEEKAKFLANQLNEQELKVSKEFYDGFYQGTLIALNIAEKEMQGMYDNIQAGNT